jgi:hypothetical protein
MRIEQVLKLKAMIAAGRPLIILIVMMILIDFIYGCAAMNLKDLKYLVALADTGHFGKAAERCFVSQPT